MKRNLSILIFSCLLLSACATMYQDITENEPHASITFEKSYDNGWSVGKGSSLMYSIYPDGNCKAPERGAFFAWMTGDTQTRRVKAGAPFRFHAELKDYQALGTGHMSMDSQSQTCSTLGEFTPKPNGSYVIKLSGVGTKCKLIVKDSISNQPIDDLIQTAPNYEGAKC